MKLLCSCGLELTKDQMGASHMYYECKKTISNPRGCGRVFGRLGKRFFWSVPAIDEMTGEIVYDYWMDADGSYRTKKEEPEQ